MPLRVSAILVLPTSILGGYTYPLMAMPEGFQKFAYYLPFVHYAEPIRDLCIKEIGMEYIQGDIQWLIHCVLLLWILCFVIFMGKKLSIKLYKNHVSKKQQNVQAEVVV